MRRADTASPADDPKAKADRILSELIGRDYDLISEEGRIEAIEAIEAMQAIETRGEPDGEQVQIPEGDTRTAWEAARGLCSDIQLGAAISRLDKLEPLPDQDDPMSGDATADFIEAKQQVRDQLVALKDEYAEENDEELLKNIYGTLFAGGESLFERLKEAGNFSAENVNDRTAERHVINYIAIRAFTAQLCCFPLNCNVPATEPEGGSRVGQALGATERALRCAKDTADRLRDELEVLGITDECSPDDIPGVTFAGGGDGEGDGDGDSESEGDGEGETETGGPTAKQAKSDVKKGKGNARTRKQQPYGSVPEPNSEETCIGDFFSILRRVEDDADDWLNRLDREGKRGARLIRSEIDRLAVKAGRYRPERPALGKDMPQVARLLELFVVQLERASEEIHKLLDA